MKKMIDEKVIYRSFRKRTIKAITILAVLIMLFSVSTSAVSGSLIEKSKYESKEENINEEDENSGLLEKLGQKLSSTKEKLKNFFTKEDKEDINKDSSQMLDASNDRKKTGLFGDLLTLNSNYSGNEKSTSLGLFKTATLNVDGIGGDDISARVFILPGFDFKSLSLTINFNLNIELLSANSINDEAFLETYASLNLPGFLLKTFNGKSLNFGYRSPQGEQIPSSCKVVYKLAPNFLRPIKKPVHIFEIDPSGSKNDKIGLFCGFDDKELIFDFEKFVKGTVKIDDLLVSSDRKISVQVDEQTSVDVQMRTKGTEDVGIVHLGFYIENLPKKTELVFKSNIKIIGSEKIDISYERISDEKVNVIFYRYNGIVSRLTENINILSDLDYFYIKYLPKEFSFSFGLSIVLLKGWIDFDTGGESVSQIGWFDDLFKPGQCLYLSDLPTTGKLNVNFNVLRKSKIHAYADKRVSLHGYFENTGYFGGDCTTEFSIESDGILDVTIVSKFLLYFEIRNNLDVERDIFLDINSDYLDLSLESHISRSSDQPFIIDVDGILNGPIYDVEAGAGVSISNGWDFSISKLTVDADEIPVYMTGLNGLAEGNRVVDFDLDVRNIELSKTNSDSGELTVSFTPILPFRRSLIDRIDAGAFRVYVSKNSEFTIDSIDSDILIKEVIVPSVNITYPKADEFETPVVSDIITVTGTATPGVDSSSINKVEIMIDKNDWKKVTGTNTWSYSWDTTALEDGTHIIKARSYDGNRYSALDTVTVEVANHVVPEVSILIPSDGDIVDGLVSVEGTAHSGIYYRPIQKVEVRVDEGTWFEANGDSYWDYAWDTSSVVNGEHLIEARSYDGYRYSVVDSVNVNKGQAQIPSVEISSPSDGSSVKGSVSIEGLASPGDNTRSVESVEISIGYGEGWAIASGTESWSYNWDASGLEPGSYAVRARSYDGIYYSSPAVISLNVEDEVENPVINITSPDDGEDVSDIVRINGTATPATQGRPIDFVQVKINDGEWKDASGKDLWSFDWDSKTVCNGYFSIQARCFDSMGYEDSDIIYVYVDNGPSHNAPSVRIDNPSLHALVEDVVNVQGQAFEGYSGRSIQQVQLAMIPQNSYFGSYEEYPWVNVTDHNSDWSSWNYDWDTSQITAGIYLIMARCYDGEYYSTLPNSKMELISSGTGVIVVVKNFDLGDRTFKFELYKEKSTYVNIGDVNVDLRVEKLPDDGENYEPFTGSFSWSSLEITSSTEPTSFELELDFEDNSVDITRSKVGNELTIEDIHIEANNIDLSFLQIPGFESVDSIINIDKLVYDRNTPKDGGFSLQLNSENDGSGISLYGEIVLSSQLELFGFYIKVNNLSWNKPELHLVGPKTFSFGLNITIQNISWNIAQDFSWGWIRVGPSGSAYMDVDFSKYEGDTLVFEVSGAFTFNSGDGLFNLSWNGLGTDDFAFNAKGDLLFNVNMARFRVRDIFALDIDKINSRNEGANFSFDISQDDGTINWERTKESASDIDLEIDLALNFDKDNQLFPLPGDFNFVLQGDVSKDSSGQTYGKTSIEWVKNESISITIDRDVNRELDFLLEDFLFSVGLETVFSVDLSCTKFERTIDQGSGHRAFFFDYSTEEDQLTVMFETSNSPAVTIEYFDLEVYIEGVLNAATGVDYFHKDRDSSLFLEITGVNIMGIIDSLQNQGITLDNISGDICFTLESDAKIELTNFYIDGDVEVGSDAFDVSLSGEYHMDKNTGRSTRIYAFADFDEKTFDIVLENQHDSQKIMEITNLDFAVSATISGITGGLSVICNRVHSVTNSGAILLEADGTMVSIDDLSGKFAFSGSISSASVTNLRVSAGATGPNQNRVYMDGDFTFQNSASTSTGFVLVINSMSSGSLNFNFNHAHAGTTIINDFTLGVNVPSISFEAEIVRDYWKKTGSGSTHFSFSASGSASDIDVSLSYNHHGSTYKLVEGLEVSISVFGFGLTKYFDVTRMKSVSSHTDLILSAEGVDLTSFEFDRIELDWDHGTNKNILEFNMDLFDTTFNLKNGEASGTLYACVDRVNKYAEFERTRTLDMDWFIIDTTINEKNFNFRIENSRDFKGDLRFEWQGDLLGMKPTFLRLSTQNGVQGSYDYISVKKNNEEIFNLIYGTHELDDFEIKVYNIQYSSNDKIEHLDFHSEWDYSGSCGSIRFLTQMIIETGFSGDLDAELQCAEGQGLDEIEEIYITSPGGITGSFKLSRNSGVKAIELTGTVDSGSEFCYKLDDKTGYDNSKHIYVTGGLDLSLVRVRDSQIRCELTVIDISANYVEFGVGDKDSGNTECKWLESTGTNTLNALDLMFDFDSVDVDFDALNIQLLNNFYAKKYDWNSMSGDSDITSADEIQLNGQMQSTAGTFHLIVTKDGSTSFEITTDISFEINADNARIGWADHNSDSAKQFVWLSSQGPTDLELTLLLGGWELSGSISFDGSIQFCKDSDWYHYSGANYYGKAVEWKTDFSRNQGINQLYDSELEFTVSRNGLILDFDGLASIDLQLYSGAVGVVGIGEHENNPDSKRLFYLDTDWDDTIAYFQTAVFLDDEGLGFRINGYDFGAHAHSVIMNKNIVGIWVPSVYNDGIIGTVDGMDVTFNGGDDWYTVLGGGGPLEVDAEYNDPDNDYFGVVGEPVHFNPEVGGGDPPYSYYWTFGDGGTSTEKDPDYTYTTVGTYTAEITVTDDSGTVESDTATVDIDYNDLEADLSGPSSATEHDTVTFSVGASGGSGNYFFDLYFGDGESRSMTLWSNPQYEDYVYVEPGQYTVTLNILDLATDATATDQYEIEIFNDNDYDFQVDLSGPSVDGIVGVPYSFTATVTGSDTKGFYDYFFDFDDGNTQSYTNVGSKTKTATHTYTETGTYYVHVEVTDGWEEFEEDTFVFDVTSDNQPPSFSDMGVSPDQGTESTSFTFTVTYTDPDNDEPTKYDVLIDDEYWGSSSYERFNMTHVSGDHDTGAVYEYTYTSGLWPGMHQFRFDFNDGEGHNEISDFQSGPSVEGWANPLFAYPQPGWNNEAKANDNDLDTSAQSDTYTSATWTEDIELNYGGITMHSNFPPLYSDQIRFKGWYSLVYCSKVHIEVHNADTNQWVLVYEGGFSDADGEGFVYRDIPGGPIKVDTMHIRFKLTPLGQTISANVYEADFHHIHPPN